MAQKEATLLLRVKQAGMELLDRFVITLDDVVKYVGRAAGALKDLPGAIFDFVKEGEKVQQINRSFESLAKSAGLSGQEIREGLVGAAKGLADDTDIILAANKAIVGLGSQAEKLPQVMELARKATYLFGGDLVKNFEAMNHAIASGNTRALKNMGIMVDAESAVNKYAESLGVSADKLNEAGKQQAIMNEVLLQGQSRYAGISDSTQDATKSHKQLSVAWKDMAESFQVLSSKLLSGTLSKGFSAVTEDVKYFTNWLNILSGDPTKKTALEIENLTVKVAAFQEQIAKMKSGPAPALDAGAIQSYEQQVTAMLQRIQDLKMGVGQPTPKGPTMAEARQLEEQRGAIATTHVIKQQEHEKQIARNETAKKQIALIGMTAEQELAAEIAGYDKKIAAAATGYEKLRLAKAQSELLVQQAEASQKAVEEQEEITELEAELERQNYYRQLDTDDKAAQLEATISHLERLASVEKDHFTKMHLMKDAGRAKDQLAQVKKAEAEVKTEKEKEAELVRQRGNFLAHMSSLQNSNNSAMVVIGKAAAIAQMTISTAEAANSGLAWGTKMGGPALGATFMALAYAAGAANIARVAGVQLAEGGVVRARPGGIQATIGEGGRDEAVIPLENGRVPGMSGNSFTIIVNGGLLGDQSSARELAVALDRELLKLRQNNESQAFDQGLV